MLKLQSAPPRRGINWYRMIPRVMLWALVFMLAACVAMAIPYTIEYITNPEHPMLNELVAADGHGAFVQAQVMTGYVILFLVVFASALMILEEICRIPFRIYRLVVWWQRKIEERDKQIREYHD